MAFSIIVCGSLAMLGHAAAIGMIAKFAHMLEKGQSLSLFGRHFPARSSYLLMGGCGVLLLLLLVVTSGLIYWSDRQAIRLRRRYQDHCTATALSRLAAGFHNWPTDSGGPADISDAARVARGDAVLNGRAAAMLVAGIIPVFTVVLALGSMLVLNVTATLLIVCLVCVSAYFLLQVNLRAASASKELERLASPASSGFRRLLNDLRDSSDHSQVDPTLLTEKVDTGAMREYLDARDRTLFALKSSRLVSDLTIAVIMCIILLTLGINLIQRGSGWGLLLAFLIILRHGLTNLRATTQMLVSINRFYPQLRRYRDFIEATQPADTSLAQPSVSVVRIAGSSLDGSMELAEIGDGSRVLLFSTGVPNRYSAGYLMGVLAGSDHQGWVAATHSLRFVISRAYVDPNRPVGEQFGLPSGITREQLFSDLGFSNVSEQWIEAVPAKLDQALSSIGSSSMTRGLRGLLSACAAAYSDAAWILIDDQALTQLPDELALHVLERLSDRVVVIVCRDVGRLDHLDVNLVVVADRGEAVGIGPKDWALAHRDDIAKSLSHAGATIVVEQEEDDDDDTLFDE